MVCNKLKFWNHNLKLRDKLIVLFSVLILSVSIVISAASVKLASNVITAKNNRYFKDITNQTTNNISQNVGNMEQITFDILSNTTIQKDLRTVNANNPVGLDKTIITNEVENILFHYTLNNDSIISLSVFSDNGAEFTANQNVQLKTYQLFDKRTIYTAKGTTLWGLTKDKNNNFCAARAIFDLATQKSIGYINVVISGNYFGDIIRNISSSFVNGTYLIDKHGIVVSSNIGSKLGESAPFYRQIMENTSDHTMYTLNGVRNYVYTGSQLGNGWKLVTLIPQNELSSEIYTLGLLIIFVNAGVILIAFGIILIFIRRFTNPIAQLCRNMEEVGRGDFKKKVLVSSNDEIGMLSGSFNSMVENIDNLIKTVYKLELSRKQAELDFLKMQINPHFLYNTLETINWMARIENKLDIANVATALGEFLRATVNQNDLITIAEEIKSVNNYLTIQAYRFGDKIKAEITADNVYDVLIPNFILQPIVENAIIHGLEPKLTNGRLQIRIHFEDDYILFTVKDDGVGIGEEELQHIHADLLNPNTKKFIGLNNVNKRLRLYYGENCNLSIESRINLGTIVSFQIPTIALERAASSEPRIEL